jgi:hypothetical protein
MIRLGVPPPDDNDEKDCWCFIDVVEIFGRCKSEKEFEPESTPRLASG